MGERTGPDGTTQELVYDQLSRHVLQETTGAQQRDYVMDVARDRILAIDSATGDDVYVYQNFRGDVRAVTSTTSAIKDVRNYLPTGVAISYAATNFPEMRYGYQGKEQQITGLQDFVNRAYDPYTGRATSFDPLRTAAGAYGNHSGLGWQDYPLVTPGSQTQSDPEGLLEIDSGVLPQIGTNSVQNDRQLEEFGFKFGHGVIPCSVDQRKSLEFAESRINKALSGPCISKNGLNLHRALSNSLKATRVHCGVGSVCGSFSPRSVFGLPSIVLYVNKLGDTSLRRSQYDFRHRKFDNPNFQKDGGSCVQGASDGTHFISSMRQRYTSTLFHEMVHAALRSIGSYHNSQYSHALIDSCAYGCRSFLGIGGYRIGDQSLEFTEIAVDYAGKERFETLGLGLNDDGSEVRVPVLNREAYCAAH